MRGLFESRTSISSASRPLKPDADEARLEDGRPSEAASVPRAATGNAGIVEPEAVCCASLFELPREGFVAPLAGTSTFETLVFVRSRPKARRALLELDGRVDISVI